eukprot:gnl/Trimastix_PCT/1739.p1 GENE.gnl/Trimastix_PCT/1739~~gnl/Trimastix_PCT/1739.p1  ORF type:complete len:727 (-),score=278.09 gnl/Trimastix_PCT/1739:139-2319(-)
MPLTVSVKVAVRCRPFNGREKERNARLIIQMDGPMTIIENPNPKSDPVTGEVKDEDRYTKFTFDYSYFWDTQQVSVYQDLGISCLEKAFEGYNATIFAYGQTGAGKSFSMTGAPGLPGIIPQMNEGMFERIRAAPPNMQYLVSVSFLEIYNEEIRDLLDPTHTNLKVRQHPSLGIFVENLCELTVNSNDRIIELMDQGNAARQVAATSMNAVSSRSHSVFTIKLEQKDKDDPTNKGLTAKVNLVDLAGSERQKSTGATGARLAEGAAINKSLSALGKVISALADPKKKKGHIPYRDSKLTRILQESLGGNTQTTMVCALSPADINYDETLSTLKYANAAKKIQNKSKRNEDENTRIIRELRQEIEKLRNQLSGDVTSPSGGGPVDEERIHRMQGMIQDLELAKQQTWDEKERMSQLYEEQRKQNMMRDGIYQVVMKNLKQQNQQLLDRISAMQQEKQELRSQYGDQKKTMTDLKSRLESEIEAFHREGGVESEHGQERLESIKGMQQELIATTAQLKETRVRMKQADEKAKNERHEFHANRMLLQDDHEYRAQIEREEREKVVQEMESKRREMEEEKKRMRAQFKKRVEAAGREHQEALETEQKLDQERAERRFLESKANLLEAQYSRASDLMDEQRMQHELEMERVQLQHLQVFRRYRMFFEEKYRRMERHYVELLQKATADCVYLSGENQKIRMRIEMLSRGSDGFDSRALLPAASSSLLLPGH